MRANRRTLLERELRQTGIGRRAIGPHFATANTRGCAGSERSLITVTYNLVPLLPGLSSSKPHAGDQRVRAESLVRRPIGIPRCLRSSRPKRPAAARHFLDAGAHKLLEHRLLEARGVRHVRTLERGRYLSPLPATRTLMHRWPDRPKNSVAPSRSKSRITSVWFFVADIGLRLVASTSSNDNPRGRSNSTSKQHGPLNAARTLESSLPRANRLPLPRQRCS